MKKLMEQLRHRKRHAIPAVAVILVLLVLAGAGAYTALAEPNDGYVTAENEFFFPGMVKDATADTTLRYRSQWYFLESKDAQLDLQTLGTPGEWDEKAQSAGRTIFKKGVDISGITKIHSRGDKLPDGSQEVTWKIEAEPLIDALLKLYGNQRQKLIKGFTLYLAPVTIGYEGRTTKKTAYCMNNALSIPDALYGTSWSGGALGSIANNYTATVDVTFTTADFEVVAWDVTNDKQIEDFTATVKPDTKTENAQEYYGNGVLYGEKLLPVTAPELEDYVVKEYKWTNGKGKETGKGNGGTTSAYKVRYDRIAENDNGDGKLVLTFYYTAASPSETPAPTPEAGEVTPPAATPAPCGHEWGPWEYNDETHWKECTKCGITGETGLHDYSVKKDEHDGNVTCTCKVCGYSYSYHSHKWSVWKHDEEYHWKECEYCGDIKSYAEHKWNSWFAVVGGQRRECGICGYFVFRGVKYTLTFDRNHPDAEGTMAPQTHTYGEELAISKNRFSNGTAVAYDSNTGLPEDPVEIVHNENSRAAAREFIGWALSPSAGPRFTDGQAVSNLTLKEGEIIPLYAYWGNASITLPKAVWDGHRFIGWKIENKGDIYYAGTTVEVTEACTLYAQWEPVYYSVAFETNGGTPCQNISVEPGKAYGTHNGGKLPVTAKDGFVFDGWRITGTETIVTADTIVTIDSDHVLEAVWTGVPYTVTFDYNFAYNSMADNPVKNGPDTKSVYYTGTYGELPAPARTGYTFIGWCTGETSGNGSGKLVTADTEVSAMGSHTLYACWLPDSYTLKFDYNYDFSVWPEN